MNQGSLATRVLKSTYYPHGDIMESASGSRPSFVWRSLFYGKELLSCGLIWPVGNGRKVKALKDRWIPREGNFTPMVGLGGLASPRVEYFINPDRTSNRERLCEWFVHPDIVDIMNIPLGLRQ